MSDRILGSSWSNPIWHGKWRIYQSHEFFGQRYGFTHDDYDGADDANDSRHGHANSVDECKAAINEMEAA